MDGCGRREEEKVRDPHEQSAVSIVSQGTDLKTTGAVQELDYVSDGSHTRLVREKR